MPGSMPECPECDMPKVDSIKVDSIKVLVDPLDVLQVLRVRPLHGLSSNRRVHHE